MIGSLLRPLLIVWGAVTAVLIVVLAWKTVIGFREADVVILDSLEDSQANAQKRLVARVESLGRLAKGLGIASLTLIILLGVLWTYWTLKVG
jgi:hypothetical protein